MLFSEAHSHKVVSTDTASTVGRIDGFVVDPSLPGIVALTVAKAANGSALPWSNVIAVGPDAVTVASADAVVVPDEQLTALADKSHGLLGKRVLSTAGIMLGAVRDVDFDPATGRLALLALDTGTVDAARLVGAGSYAVIVRA